MEFKIKIKVCFLYVSFNFYSILTVWPKFSLHYVSVDSQ